MTIFDASLKLYGWFSEHDSFCLETDEKKLMSDVKRKKFEHKEEIAAIKCALDELCKMEVIETARVDDSSVWVLKKSFQTLTQNLNLSPETAMSVAQIVNGFCEAFNMDTEKADPKELSEQDIKNLVFVCAHLMDKSTDPLTPPPSDEEL